MADEVIICGLDIEEPLGVITADPVYTKLGDANGGELKDALKALTDAEEAYAKAETAITATEGEVPPALTDALTEAETQCHEAALALQNVIDDGLDAAAAVTLNLRAIQRTLKKGYDIS